MRVAQHADEKHWSDYMRGCEEPRRPSSDGRVVIPPSMVRRRGRKVING